MSDRSGTVTMKVYDPNLTESWNNRPSQTVAVHRYATSVIVSTHNRREHGERVRMNVGKAGITITYISGCKKGRTITFTPVDTDSNGWTDLRSFARAHVLVRKSGYHVA